MNPIPKTKIIRLKGQKLAKLNEMIHQRDQHKCIYCGNGDNNPRYERISTTSE